MVIVFEWGGIGVIGVWEIMSGVIGDVSFDMMLLTDIVCVELNELGDVVVVFVVVEFVIGVIFWVIVVV